MRVVFRPANQARCPSSVDPKIGSGVPMVSGRIYDLTPEWIAHINATSPGVDGVASCVPVDAEAGLARPPAPAPAGGARPPRASRGARGESPAPAVTYDPSVELT